MKFMDLSSINHFIINYLSFQRDLLVHLMSFGYTLSPEDQLFLENETDSDALENVDAGSS